jgi:hypothetical protein
MSELDIEGAAKMNTRLGPGVLLVAGLLALGGTLPVRAEFTMVVTSEPKGGGSWVVGLGLPSDIPYDLVTTRITTGEHYGDQAFLDFNLDRWSEVYNDPAAKEAAARGAFFDDLEFILHFSGDFEDPVHFDVAAFSGNTLLGAMHGHWTGPGPAAALLISDSDWNGLVGMIPAPAAVLLGVVGLGLIAVLKRKL